MTPADIEMLVQGRHGDAFGVLGPHLVNAIGEERRWEVRAFRVRPEPFSIENGMLTANGKFKRDLISASMRDEIEEMYRVKQAV